MFHVVHVIHVHLDPQRVAAFVRVVAWALAAWLVWHYLPEAWPAVSAWFGHFCEALNAWLGHLCDIVLAPFAWAFGIIGSGLRFLAVTQAVLLPAWALLAGLALGTGQPGQGSALWLGMAGLDAACAVLLGYPALGGMVALGSLAALWAALTAEVPIRGWTGWTGWLAAALVAGVSAWGTVRYGAAFAPVCWLLVPASWCCLALGAAYGVRCQAGGWLRDSGTARLLGLAATVSLATVGPFATDAVRTTWFLPSATLSAAVGTAPKSAVAGDAAAGREAALTALPARQPGSTNMSRGGVSGGKPVSPPTSTRPRT